MLRIIYMGTPYFAVPALKALIEGQIKIHLVCALMARALQTSEAMRSAPYASIWEIFS